MALWTSAIEKGTMIIHKDRIVEVMDVVRDYDNHMNIASFRVVCETSDDKHNSYTIVEYKLTITDEGAGYDVFDWKIYCVLVDKPEEK